MGLNKQMMAGVIAALVTGLMCNIIFPSVVGVVLAALASGLTILDPFHTEEDITSAWFTLGAVLLAQIVYTLIVGVGVGALIGLLASRLQSFWLYPVGLLLSILLHLCVFIVLVSGLNSITNTDSSSVFGVTVGIAIFVAPLIGLVSVFSVRQWGGSTT